MLTELAQNAADAASKAGVAGRVEVWLDGRELHIGNTGAPLDIEGVQALSALRASGKLTGHGESGSVGQFGVGFTAVLSVSAEVEIRSTTGSVRFSAVRTRAALGESGIDFAATPPVLRLPWPTEQPPRSGLDTEVVLQLRPDVDIDALLTSMNAEAIGLLLELPALESIRIDGSDHVRRIRSLAGGVDEVSIADRQWWQYRTARARWLVPMAGGSVRPAAPDVLRAPTRSDEELSLPAIVIADIAMQPDRRRILPGAHIDELAAGYADFVRALPAAQRLALIPLPSFGRSEADSILREAVIRELRSNPWLPVLGKDSTGKDSIVAPPLATVLTGLTDELAELLEDVIPALVPPDFSGLQNASALAQVDVHRIGLARVAEMLGGIDRSPQWWHRLYAALDGLGLDGVATEELGALPVPLADGRLVTGPRTTVLTDDVGATGAAGDRLPVHWVRLVHPAAAHPLLGRLGARHASAIDLLSDSALHAELDELDDEQDLGGPEFEDRAAELADAVLSIAASVTDPQQLPSWLGLLPLRDDAEQLRPADELLLPGAPLATVLVAESPFGTVDSTLVARFGERALQAVGVGWGFTVVRDDLPTGPDHDLDDESAWWATLVDDPASMAAVRDLDLVADESWPQALTLLARDPAIRPLLTARDGYPAWWLGQHAHIGGQRLGILRHPDDNSFAGLLDELDHPEADAVRSALVDPEYLDHGLAQVLVDRLCDADRHPSPAVATDTYRRLGEAVVAGRIDSDEIVLPDRVRTLAGTLVDSSEALVLDEPWLAAAIPLERLVVGTLDAAQGIARLLDLPLASEELHGEAVGGGQPSTWDRVPGAVLFFASQRLPLPVGAVVVHEELSVRLRGALETTVQVPWWVDADRVTHIAADFGRRS